MQRIVIIGGGFAGVNMAKAFTASANFQVTLVDRNNYNQFSPLLYQVTTGFLEISNISYPFRKLFRKSGHVNFRLGELVRVIPEQNKVLLSTGELAYEYLIIATGAQSNFFGLESVKKNALPMKTINDALLLRNHLISQLENAAVSTDHAARLKLLTIVVAGAGPTGIEISGMLAQMKKQIFLKDYPELTGGFNDLVFYLVEGADAVLTSMSVRSQHYSFTALQEVGVTVKLNCLVNDYSDGVVTLTSGEKIETNTLIWAAGIEGSLFDGLPSTCYGRGKRLLVDEFNQVEGVKNIYAIGDACLQTTDPAFPKGHPQLAQTAIQQGKHLALNFIRMNDKKERIPFIYHNKGTLAIIGRYKAVCDIPRPQLFLSGFPGWIIWVGVHLMGLISTRNKAGTFFNWCISFFTHDQSLRMIIRPEEK